MTRKSRDPIFLSKKDSVKNRSWFVDTTNWIEKKESTEENLEMFFKIDNIVEKWEQKEVWGIASSEVVDVTWDIVTYDAMKDAWEDYARYWNIREMHQPRAVWVLIDSEFLDDKKATFIKVKIADDDVWEKIKMWVYKWFSIWARILDAEWRMVDWNEVFVITKMTLVEISVVDRPACQEANIEWYKFISLTNESMTKSLLEKFMSGKKEDEQKEVTKNDEAANDEANQDVTKWEDAQEWDELSQEWEWQEWAWEEAPKDVEWEWEWEDEDVVEVSKKSLDALIEKVDSLSESLTKVLEFNDKLVKWLDLSFDNLSTKFEKVDEIEKTLKNINTSKRSVQKDVEIDLSKSQSKEISFKDIFWLWWKL